MKRFGHLDRYRVRLDVKSPLFIGCNEKLNQREYISLGRKWLIPSMPLLIRELTDRGLLASFEEYITDPKRANTQKLGDWLRNNGLPLSGDAPYIRYSLDSNYPSVGNDLACCIKQQNGSPFIPGSSIKGALRTAFIASKMNATQANALLNGTGKEIENVPRVLRYEQDKIDAHCDILKGLEISDSTPFAPNSLVVCRLYNAMDDAAGSTKFTAMPLYRECIRPGSSSYFYLTIDRNVLPNMTKNMLQQMLFSALKREEEYFNMFSLYSISIKETSWGNGMPLILGAGTGFQNKSLILHAAKLAKQNGGALEHNILRMNFPNRHNGKGYYKPPRGDFSPAPYCRKLAEMGEAYYPFGRCELTFTEDA